MIVETTKIFRSVLSSEREVSVKFEQIKKLGEDVILVDIT